MLAVRVLRWMRAAGVALVDSLRRTAGARSGKIWQDGALNI
jgi:hypothetical protein